MYTGTGLGGSRRFTCRKKSRTRSKSRSASRVSRSPALEYASKFGDCIRIHLVSEYAPAEQKSVKITSHLRRIMRDILLQRAQNRLAAESATVIFLRPLSIIHVDTETTWRGGQESLIA